MLLSRVRILVTAWRARKRLGLSIADQRKLRALVLLDPLNAELIYPTVSVRRRFPRSGLYERTFETRDSHGMPRLVRIRYLYIGRSLDVFIYELDLLWPVKTGSIIHIDHMETAEQVALAMVSAHGDPA